MLALWDTTGSEVVRKLAAERRNGGVASGLALTLVAVVDEARPGGPPRADSRTRLQEVEDAVTVAASSHPSRLLVVVRAPTAAAEQPDRLDAEIIVGGRLGPCEAVIMRMQGRLALHAESVVMPLLAPDVPVVTWWHGPPPEHISQDPLGVVAERRITDSTLADQPVAALRQRAVDYAAGDTDLAWTRVTGLRTLVAGATDPLAASGTGFAVASATVTAPGGDASAALLLGWLADRLGVTPSRLEPAAPEVESVRLVLTDGTEVAIARHNGVAVLRRTGQRELTVPMLRPTLGDDLAEELRRLGSDQSYAAALSAATGVTGLQHRPATRVHTWVDPLAQATPRAAPPDRREEDGPDADRPDADQEDSA